MTLHRHPRPLFPLAIALMVGLVLGERYAVYIAPWVVAGACVLVAALAAARVRLGRTWTAPVIIVLVAFLGTQLIAPWAAPRFPANHITHWIDTGRVSVSGRVEAVLPQARFGSRFIMVCEQIRAGPDMLPVTGRLRVFASGVAPEMAPGDQVDLQVDIRPVRSYGNPGGFDYGRHLARQGIWALGKADGYGVRVRSGTSIFFWRGRLQGFRQKIAEQIGTAVGTGPSAGVIRALVIGDRSGIDREQRAAFNRAGVGHLLAISGLHVGIVAAATFTLLRWLLAWLPCLLWRAWVLRCAAALTLVPVVGYGLLAGMSPSTQRAVIMVSVGLAAMLAQKDQDLLNTLAAAALVILLVSPPALFSVSFQLSFAAVLAIVYGLSCLPKHWRRAPGRLLPVVTAFFWVSLLAQLGTLPLVMGYFDQVSLVGLAANILLIPLVGFGVVPVGLASALAGRVSPTVATMGFQVCAALADIALALIRWFSELPFAAVNTFVPHGVEVFGAYALGWAVLNLIRDPVPVAAVAIRRTHAAERRRRIAAWSLAVLVLLGGMDTAYWLYRRFWHRDLRVTVLDVGQGSSALVEFPGGSTMLIDGGGFSDNAIFDVGQRLVAPVLRKKRIFTVDTVVLSHPNSDHVNGLTHIVSRFEVGRVWTNNMTAETQGYRDFFHALSKKGWVVVDFSALARHHVIGGVRVDILFPPARFRSTDPESLHGDLNDFSLVLRMEKDGVAFLFPGDITSRAEADLVRRVGRGLRSRVLVVPHHGSRHSSSAGFIKAVAPHVAVVSVGWRNRFGFPHPDVLDRYARCGCRLYRTDRHGAVIFRVINGCLVTETSKQE